MVKPRPIDGLGNCRWPEPNPHYTRAILVSRIRCGQGRYPIEPPTIPETVIYRAAHSALDTRHPGHDLEIRDELERIITLARQDWERGCKCSRYGRSFQVVYQIVWDYVASGLKLKEIAKKHKVTVERIRQLKMECLRVLRQANTESRRALIPLSPTHEKLSGLKRWRVEALARIRVREERIRNLPVPPKPARNRWKIKRKLVNLPYRIWRTMGFLQRTALQNLPWRYKEPIPKWISPSQMRAVLNKLVARGIVILEGDLYSLPPLEQVG